MFYKRIKYDYQCGIELFTVCNYRCEYCSGPRVRKLTRRGRTQQDIDKVVRFFNNSGATWLLAMSGGEPTVHPFFGELVSGLKGQHYFFFFTNLSFDVEAFIQLLPAERVQCMKTSLHPEADVDVFLDKYETLFGFGYNPVLIMVSAPHMFDRIEKVAAYCRQKQFPYTLSVMDGPYREKNYPNDYTRDEVRFIEEHTCEPGNLIRLRSQSPGGMNTFGCACPAGKRSFFLDMESGDLKTCEAVYKVHGNVYENIFEPQKEDTICPAINSCVAYDWSMNVPHAYRSFFSEGWNCWRLQDVKRAPNYPENLISIINADKANSSRQVKLALDSITRRLGASRTLFWGAGTYGSKILYHLRQGRAGGPVHVLGFVDSLKDRQKVKVLGLPVYAPQHPFLNEVDKILITSHAYENEIAVAASRLGLQAKVIALHRELLEPLGIKGSIF